MVDNALLQSRTSSKELGVLKGLWPFMKPYRLMMFFASFALVSTAAVSLLLPLAVRQIIDSFNAQDGAILDRYFVISVLVAALLAIGTALRYALVTRFGERVVTDIRKTVFDRVIHMSPQFYENILTGEVISRITTDTTLILSVIGSSVSVALRNTLIFAGGLILMLFTSAKLTGLVLLIVPAVVLPILVLGRRVRKLSRENQDWIASSSSNAAEALGAVQTIQAYTNEDRSVLGFSDVNERAYVSAKFRIKTRAQMTAIMIFLVFTGIVGVLWIGAQDVRTGTMSAGVLVQFVIYSVMVAGSVAALSEVFGELQRAAGATERLIELLNATDELQDAQDPVMFKQPPEGKIDFCGVDFDYPSRPEMPALQSVSFSIKSGETIAIVGPSGAGKSTIIQMLLRFYDPTRGHILIDGVDLRDMARSDFRNHISLVAQDPVIFAMSVLENIRFGRPNATDEQVKEAARAAAAYDFVNQMPNGFDTYVGERGVMLSGGQKQRIAIARAILRNAPILLLDEATSALDAESERAVQTAVDRLSKGRTTLVVAHRLATVKQADRILVMEQGRIIAVGHHDELVAQDGLYARLARLQFTDGIQSAP